MKKLFNLFAVLLAFTALSFGFVSCSDDDDDDTVAVYKSSDATANEYELVTFYSDNTCKVHGYAKITSDGITIIVDLDYATGTYTGNPNADGEVVITVNKEAQFSESYFEDETVVNKLVAEALNGKTTFTFTNSDFPLEPVIPYEMTATISGKNATVVDEDGEEMTFTRQ